MPSKLAVAGALAGLAAGAYLYAAMYPQSQLFGRTVVAGRSPSEFALTYDDGPNDPYTPQLLDLLAEHNVRATFFMIGGYVRQRPDLVRRVHAAGHLIGNHTMSHPFLPLLSPRRVEQELAGCNARLEDVLGAPVRFFRPPHGARRPDILRTARRLGLTAVLWNAMGFDWQPKQTGATIAAHLTRGVAHNLRRGRGSNLLLHDGGHLAMGTDRSRSIEATRLILRRWSPGTTQYVTVDAWA